MAYGPAELVGHCHAGDRRIDLRSLCRFPIYPAENGTGYPLVRTTLTPAPESPLPLPPQLHVSVKTRFTDLNLLRLFPYGITVGSLAVVFIIIMLIMLGQNNLDPMAVILGSFILIVLFITGLIETAIQLFGNVSLASPYLSPTPFLSRLPLLPRLPVLSMKLMDVCLF